MTRKRAALLVVAVLLTVAALRGYSSAFVWVFGVWFVVCALEAAAGPASRRLLMVNSAAALLTLAMVESWWSRESAAVRREAAQPTVDPPSYTRLDEVVGYAPAPSMTATARLRHGSELSYDVQYTVDESGLRVAPPCNCRSETTALLFFGCSYTYGEGVEDDETLPFRTGVQTGGRYSVYNFGFHGYGPHQMLAMLEHGVVEAKVAYPPRFAFYSAGVDHVRRAAGRAAWDTYLGPRYVLDDSGGVRYVGPFRSTIAPGFERPGHRATAILGRSEILQRLWPGLGEERDAEQFIAIVDAARTQLEQRFPGIEFRVLFWGSPGRRQRALVEGLRRRGVVVYEVADFLPDYVEHPERYRIPFDNHPNADAYDQLARVLAERVISMPRFDDAL